MSGPSKAFSIIPVTAWGVAVCIWLGLAGLLTVVVSKDPSIPPLAAVTVVVIAPSVLALFALLVGYVYADAKRREMRYVMWTWLAVLIPNCIGIILYFLLREPLPRPCVGCGTPVKGTFAFCPKCGAAITPSCPQCKRTVEPGWAACAWCGHKLG